MMPSKLSAAKSERAGFSRPFAGPKALTEVTGIIPYERANAAPVSRSGVAEEPLSEALSRPRCCEGGFSLSPVQTYGGTTRVTRMGRKCKGSNAVPPLSSRSLGGNGLRFSARRRSKSNCG
jgi:hypothetical protein